MRVRGCIRVRPGGPHREAGFTLIEVLVVLVIIAIVLTVALPSVRQARTGSEGGTMVAAGATVWRAISEYRLDNRGQLPPTNLVSSAQVANFRSPTGTPYLRRWPSNPGSDVPLPVRSSPPPAGTAAIVYERSSEWHGTVAAYTSTGARVYCRSIASTSFSAWTNGSVVRPGAC